MPLLSDSQSDIAKKGVKKFERPKTEDGVDLISNMPDAIILLILSRLPSTEEVIRSSSLSRRWRNLWTAIPSLDLDIRYGRRYKKDEYKELVYWVLENRSADLDCLRLFCSYDYSMSTVWRWIHSAVRKNVKQLDLTFCPKDHNEDIEMPHCLVTCASLEVLRLDSSSLRGLPLPKFIGFPALRVLDLTDVDFLENVNLVEEFLKSCRVLEDLTLTNCVLCKLDLLCISCLNLKKLSIINMDNDNDDGVLCGGLKICCPKLVDLELRGYIAYSFSFERLDFLKKAIIEPKLEGNTISELFPAIYRVEHLWIDPYFFIECIYAALDPGLPNLKNLVLKTTLYAFTMDKLNSILKYYPKLESFKVIIEQDFHETEEYEWLDEEETRSILTPDLKRLELFEFNGEKPKVVIEWFECILKMFFSWGKEAEWFNL